jgi:hypothetical protein
MTKNRKWSNQPKNNPPVQKNNESELIQKDIASKKEPTDKKSFIVSGIKYVYIVAAAALLSGIFTPLTLGVEIEDVLSGMFSLFLGLGGGIVIFLGIKNQKFTTIMICGGLGMMAVSLILILELADRSLFG